MAERVDVVGGQRRCVRPAVAVTVAPSGRRGSEVEDEAVGAGAGHADVHAVAGGALVVVEQGVAVVGHARRAPWSRRCRRCPAGRRTAPRRRPAPTRVERPSSSGVTVTVAPVRASSTSNGAVRTGAPVSSATNRSVRRACGGQSAQAASMAREQRRRARSSRSGRRRAARRGTPGRSSRPYSSCGHDLHAVAVRRRARRGRPSRRGGGRRRAAASRRRAARPGATIGSSGVMPMPPATNRYCSATARAGSCCAGRATPTRSPTAELVVDVRGAAAAGRLAQHADAVGVRRPSGRRTASTGGSGRWAARRSMWEPGSQSRSRRPSGSTSVTITTSSACGVLACTFNVTTLEFSTTSCSFFSRCGRSVRWARRCPTRIFRFAEDERAAETPVT